MRTFISHSHEDTAAYSSLCLVLDSAKISRWDAVSLSPGQSLAEQLRLAIERCSACVFVATQLSLQSQWCLAELGAFWGAGKTVIGYIADPKIQESQLPPQFSGQFWTNDARRLATALTEMAGRGRKWSTEWRLGSKLYREELVLWNESRGRVWGKRTTSEEGGKPAEYRVTGYQENGFWWLEYHDEAEPGGGTILVKNLSDRRLRGVVVSVNCDTGHIRCISNQWVKAGGDGGYDSRWQVPVGELPAESAGNGEV